MNRYRRGSGRPVWTLRWTTASSSKRKSLTSASPTSCRGRGCGGATGVGPEERFLLAAYYLDRRTLAEIAKLQRVHESTISRKLDRMTTGLRKRIRKRMIQSGMSPRQADEALQDVDVRDLRVKSRGNFRQEAPNGAFYKREERERRMSQELPNVLREALARQADGDAHPSSDVPTALVEHSLQAVRPADNRPFGKVHRLPRSRFWPVPQSRNRPSRSRN